MITGTVEGNLQTKELDLAEGLEKVARYKQENIREKIRSVFSPMQTGQLADSIEYEVFPSAVEWTANTRYAWIQQEGGFVNASPVTVIRRFNPQGKTAREQRGVAIKPFRTYQMARYFWALWFQTGDEKYMRMALYVHRHGGVTIEGKRYMDWTQQEVDEISEMLKDHIITFYNTQGEAL